MNNTTESTENYVQGRYTMLQRAWKTMNNATDSAEDDEQRYREHGGR